MARNRHSGFTYLTLLISIAIMGAVLASFGMMWSTAQQRENERELLFVGGQFRNAIAQYYLNSPGAIKKYPASLEDLLKDNRQLATKRYLRKLFVDPLTRSNKWGLVKSADGRIMGVFSLSEEQPLKTDNFPDINLRLKGKKKYSEWHFVYARTITPR